MVNKVILIGNVGREPEVRDLESGAKVASFSLATNENYKDKSGEWQQVTEWHNITMWRAQAERAERSLKKGSKVYIEGKLSTRKWQDKDGNDRYTTDVVSNYFRILDRSESSGINIPPMPISEPAGSGPVVDKPLADSPANKVEDDLPF